MTGLLFEILEIEVKVGHDGGSGFAYSQDVLDDGGTMGKISWDTKGVRPNKPDDTLPRARYRYRRLSESLA